MVFFKSVLFSFSSALNYYSEYETKENKNKAGLKHF